MTATLPHGARPDGKPATRPTARGRSRSLFSALRRTAKDWLDRPMTSWHLIIAIFFLLLGFGLLMVLSASSIASYHNNDGAPFATFEGQALFAVIGMFGFLFASRLSTRVMRTFSFLLVAVSILLLAVVLVIGHEVGGAKSWIILGPIQFQPSEVAKLALLIWMGHTLAARRNTLRSIRSLLFPVLPVFLLMVALIMKEPDLGTTVSLGIIFIAVMWFGGAPWWMFAVLTASAGGAVVFLATSAGYRSLRVLAWLRPAQAVKLDKDALYQISQSFYGLGHGGIFGAGLGQAIAKNGWLPNADSDFIFAIIGEELGLIGAGLVVLLFALLAYTGLRIARRNVDPFIKIVASSATVWLVGQAAINIGYVVGLLPVTGIPLPMISRGGTSLVITMVVFGLLANFARREPQAAAALHSQGPGRMARFLGLGIKPPKPPKPRRARPDRPHGSARPATAKRAPGAERSMKAQRAARALDVKGAQPARRRQEESARGRDQGPRAGSRGSQSEGRGGSRRQSRQTAPPLRRSGDGGAADTSLTDWQGRPFVDPDPGRDRGPDSSRTRRRPSDPRDNARAGNPRENSRAGNTRSSRGSVRGGERGRNDGDAGRGRTVRP